MEEVDNVATHQQVDLSALETLEVVEDDQQVERRAVPNREEIEDENGQINGDSIVLQENDDAPEGDTNVVRNGEQQGQAKDGQNEDSGAKRLEKLNLLLAKTETYSKFIEQNLCGASQPPRADSISKGDDDEREQDGEEMPKKGTRKRKRQTPTKMQKKQKMIEKTINASSSSSHELLRIKTPKMFKNGSLRQYQLLGLNWLASLYENGVNGILADEMGLGKTIQTIAFLAHLCENGVKGPFLVVAPLSTLSNWVNEVKRFTPDLHCLLYHGSKEERSVLRFQHFQDIPTVKMNIIVTSYELAMRDKKFLKRYEFKYLIVDEAHRLKNFNCRLVRELKQYKSDNRLLLTGTPLQNNLSELWSLLNFLIPELFDDLDSFQKWFDFSKKDNQQGRDDQVMQEREQLVQKLHNILRPFILRRLKADVELEIPSKQEYVVFAPMAPLQKEFYDAMRDKNFAPIFKKYVDSGKDRAQIKTKSLLNILMQLRKVCNHPFLVNPFAENENESEKKHTKRFLKSVVEASGKFQVLDKMLDELKAKGHKVLIFSQMTRMLDVLEQYLMAKEELYCRIDGSVAQPERQRQIDEFNNDPNIFCFLLSTRAGGLGINLTSADTVIIYDSDWNPQNDLQAMDRCHRIGQKKKVHIFRLITQNSVERKILDTALKKLALERLIIRNFKGNFEEKQKLTVTAQNLLEILTEEKEFTQESIQEKELLRLLDRKLVTHSGKGFELLSYGKGDGLSFR